MNSHYELVNETVDLLEAFLSELSFLSKKLSQKPGHAESLKNLAKLYDGLELIVESLTQMKESCGNLDEEIFNVREKTLLNTLKTLLSATQQDEFELQKNILEESIPIEIAKWLTDVIPPLRKGAENLQVISSQNQDSTDPIVP